MSNKTVDETLAGLLRTTFQGNQNGATPLFSENRIFTNRNMKMSRIQALGFDMDFTLAQYNQAGLDTLTLKMVLDILVKQNDFPESIRQIPYQESFAIRGLVIDTELGNILKMDKFRYVSLAYHGLKPLPSEEKADIYNAGRISFNSGRYRAVDTLFELLETYLYAALIDHLESLDKFSLTNDEIFKALRTAIDLCHRDGSLKKEIMSHPELYIQDDPMLVPTLHQFREAGKRLFVVTNSEPQYTDFVLNFLFRNAAPFFSGWRDCFEIVGTFARKPSFFQKGQPLEIIEEKPSLFFSGGNIHFLEQKLGLSGDQVLYVGDHIYGDILKSKHNSGWRTCIIVPELTFQIRAERRAKPHLKELLQNESRRKELIMEINWRRVHVSDLHQFKEAEADELDLRHLEKIDQRIQFLNRQLEANHKELSELLHASKKFRRQISNGFNPFWGRLFKTGGQLSLIAEQIRDYACIYTSAVSNFNFYGTQSYFKSMVTPMPHEKGLYEFGDINFDSSLEETKDGRSPQSPTNDHSGPEPLEVGGAG